MFRERAHPWGCVIVNFAAFYRTVNCSSVYNTMADASQIRMRETCALRISREIRGDTLLISRLSRFSSGGTQLHRWENEEGEEEGRKEEVDSGWKRVKDDGEWGYCIREFVIATLFPMCYLQGFSFAWETSIRPIARCIITCRESLSTP